MDPVLCHDNEAGKAASIESLILLTKADMAKVNRLILSMAKAQVDLIPEIAEYLISSGGKRLRPMLTLAAAHMCGYRGEGHIKLAASVEFMHTATLLHDDVVDESAMRRGKKTARMVWGNQASVLVGDYLLGQAFRMMVEVGSLKALDILSTASAIIAEGEVKQLTAAKDTRTSQEDYLDIIASKTAALFSAAAEVGPVLNGADKARQSALAAFGKNLGLAFQLVDDVLDYGGSSANLGKEIGDDLREGKITLPVILAYQHGAQEEREFFDHIFSKDNIAKEDLARTIAIMKRHDALKSTLELAALYAENAKQALAPFAESPIKSALLETAAFCLWRAY